jgi:hypothetical protein
LCTDGFNPLSEWQFSVLKLYADFSETPCPSGTPTENNHKGFQSCEVGGRERSSSKGAGYTFDRTLPENIMNKSEVQNHWYEVWHHFFKLD